MAEAEQLVRLAADRGRLVTVYQDRRWDGEFHTVKQLLKSSALWAQSPSTKRASTASVSNPNRAPGVKSRTILRPAFSGIWART